MIVERVTVVEDPVAALRVVSMPDAEGPWRSVLEVGTGVAQRVYVVTDDDTAAERVYFIV